MGEASVGEGLRVYAVGDVHGRLDLLKILLRKIIKDNDERGLVQNVRLILLGDLIDRGHDSKKVVALAMKLAASWPGFECLKGNHEEILERAFAGNDGALNFLRDLGRETLISYRIEPELIDHGAKAAVLQDMVRKIPQSHRDFIGARPDQVIIGDYCFVHAGIKPGVPLKKQRSRDMRWIRDKFLKSEAEHSHVIVHGHSITRDVDVNPQRIGIDTGAYATGRLTALGLEGTDHWFLST